MKKLFNVLFYLLTFLAVNSSIFAATNQFAAKDTDVWYWEEEEVPVATVDKSNLTLYAYNIVDIKQFLTTVDSVSIQTIQVYLTKVSTIDVETLNLIFQKVDKVDIATLNLILSKISTLDLASTDLIIQKLTLASGTLGSITIGSNLIDELLGNIDRVIVGNAADDAFIKGRLKMKIIEMLANGPKNISAPVLTAYLMKARVDVWNNEWTKLKDIKASYRFGKFDFATLGEWADRLATLPKLEQIAYVPFPSRIKNIRMISEVKTPKTVAEAENQMAELDYLYNEWGYRGMLIVSEGEDPISLSAIAKEYKAKGWVVGFTYGGREDKVEVPYIPVEKMEAIMRALAPHCDFFILTWRVYTGNHWEGSEQYAAYTRMLSCLARTYNPNIALIGDKFVILENRTLEVKNMRTYDVPNVSGHMISNLGIIKVNTRKLVESFTTDVVALPIVAGPSYYYRTRWLLSIDKKSIREICKKVEEDCLQSGKIPLTITLGGDGSGDRENNSDSLTKTTWRNE